MTQSQGKMLVLEEGLIRRKSMLLQGINCINFPYQL